MSLFPGPRRWLAGFACVGLLAVWAGRVRGADKSSFSGADLTFFESKVRPLLVSRCQKCHGAERQKAELRLDSREAILKGGESGPAVRLDKPEDSLLIAAVRHGEALKMPPQSKLPAAEIATLVAWVKMGLPWPDAATAKTVALPMPPKASGPLFTPEQRSFWAFQRPKARPLPVVRDRAWLKSPIDAFVLAGLEAQGLRPAAAADMRTLLRRVYFDLIGLPPTPAEIHAFERAATGNPQSAIAAVVDRLLASPHYGERWGRRWLDVARYADSNGMDENVVHGNAWRYRDYVINVFNRDKPYDQFLCEQLAGDLLPGNDLDVRFERITATGLLCIGPKMLAEDDSVKMKMDIIDEQIDTVGQAFLGLTLGCARCHDHKFDPIPTADYYSLAGIFKSTMTMDSHGVWHERPLAAPEAIARQKEHDRLIRDKNALLDRRNKWLEKVRVLAGLGATQLALAREVATLEADLKRLQRERPILPEAMAVEEGKIENVRIHLRGNHLTQGAEVPRQFPRILAGESQTPLDAKRSGRLELARWLTRADHPLTARVLVNRVWLGHFGEGLVRSPDNFGRLGERPSHPDMLDWLALRFVEGGWSIKKLHRLIILSSTYQMSTSYEEKSALADPENRRLWRFNRQRLDAEALRDAFLALSGRLDPTMGGSLITVPNRMNTQSFYPNANYNAYDFNRRSVYLPVIRSDVFNVLQTFDFADPSVPTGKRPSTTVAPQALFMMNGKLVHESTRLLAQKLLEATVDDASRVCILHEKAYARRAEARDVVRALAFVERYQRELHGEKLPAAEQRLRGWQALCQALVCANEFLYVE